MSIHFRCICILGIGLACFYPAAAPAQDLGRIERIAEILGGRTAREIRQATPKVQTRRAGTAAWANAAPGAAVTRNQNILVQRYVDARLNVEGSAHRGHLVLLPELLGSSGGRVFPAAAGQQAQEGVYGLGTQTERADEVMVAVDRGALVVDWVHGRLVVVAGGTRTVVTGTRVAFSTEEDGESGYLFLEEGSVSFPDYPEVTAPVGELVRLQRGLPPAVVVLGVTDAQSIRDAMRFHTHQIWAQAIPLWRRPAFLVPAAVAVVGGLVCAVACGGGEQGPPVGTVIIRLPPP